MGLSSKDRAFNTKKVSYLDFKHLEMDRVLTALFARLAHNGFPSRLKRRFELSVEAFVNEFLEHPEWFTGFSQLLFFTQKVPLQSSGLGLKVMGLASLGRKCNRHHAGLGTKRIIP